VLQRVTARGGTRDTINIVDFGPGRSVTKSFTQQKAANAPGKSPPMCSEFYTGWLTHWGENMANTCAPLPQYLDAAAQQAPCTQLVQSSTRASTRVAAGILLVNKV
jgi:Glycosyl hydrolases family 35